MREKASLIHLEKKDRAGLGMVSVEFCLLARGEGYTVRAVRRGEAEQLRSHQGRTKEFRVGGDRAGPCTCVDKGDIADLRET